MQAYDKYKDSGVEWLGEIPEHWECKRLGTWFEERRTKVSDRDFEPLSVTKNGVLPQLENAAKSNDGDNRKLVIKGDFVINSRSDRKGSSGISNRDGSVSLINIVLKPRGIFSAYTNYLLKSHSFIEEFYRNGHGIVADLWTTRFDEMKFINIVFPPLPEQEAIATFLDDKCEKIDEAVRIKQQQIEKLKELRQITIHNAVTKGINPEVEMKDSGIDWIGEIPRHWEVKRLKYVLKAQGRIGFKGYSTSDLVDEGEGALVLGASHMDWDGNIKLEEPVYLSWKKYFESPEIMVSKGDIIIVQRGSTCGKVAAVLKDFGEVTINPSLVLLKNIIANNIFCFFAIKCSLQYILALMSKTAIPMISQEQINNISIAMPSLAEQKEIVAYLDAQTTKTDKAIALKTEQITKLNEYKQSLINDVVTGKIKVTN